MKSNLAMTLIVCALAAACGKTPSPVVSMESSPATQSSNDSSIGAEVDATQHALLIGGYVPKFAHKVRSQRHEAVEDGQYRHIVIVEFMGQDAAAVGEALKQELVGRGLTVKGPALRNDGAERYQAQNSKVGVMFADISASPKLKLSPDAKGTIYFSWKDAVSR